MQFGHHYFSGRAFLFLYLVNWNSATVVDNRYRTFNVNNDMDLGALSGKRFVNGIVNDLIDKMMQPVYAG